MSMSSSSLIRFFKENQPIAYTGTLTHAYYWTRGLPMDVIYRDDVVHSVHDGDKNEGVAVYYVHGTSDGSKAFEKLDRRLRRKTLPSQILSTHLIAFPERFRGKSIEFFAEILAKKIAANGHKKVILIAHSRGGLVTSFFAQNYAVEYGVDVLLNVAICSPFSGAPLAMTPLTWISHSVYEMAMNSDFTKNLRQQILTQPNCDYLFFAAQQDALVAVESASIKEYVDQHPNSMIELDRHGHLSIMSSYRLVEHVYSAMTASTEKHYSSEKTTISQQTATVDTETQPDDPLLRHPQNMI